jgi:hypothetical protein
MTCRLKIPFFVENTAKKICKPTEKAVFRRFTLFYPETVISDTINDRCVNVDNFVEFGDFFGVQDQKVTVFQ